MISFCKLHIILEKVTETMCIVLNSRIIVFILFFLDETSLKRLSLQIADDQTKLCEGALRNLQSKFNCNNFLLKLLCFIRRFYYRLTISTHFNQS